MKTPVFFDVDNTLINGQTQKMLASYLRRKGKLNSAFFLKTYFWFLLYKLGIVSNVSSVMQKSYRLAKGLEVVELEEMFRNLFLEEIEPKIFPQAIEVIKDHQLRNHEVILVSSSIEPLVNIIKTHLDLPLCIATSLESKNGTFTGKIQGNIVYEKEKVRIIKKLASEKEWDLKKSYAYTDHYSDLSLLKEVSNPIVVNPDNKLKKEAQRYNWPILQWK